MMPLSLTVNGERVEGGVEPRTSLADFLRGVCGLTGTHLGCEHGVCGACTIMIDGRPARSCITYAVQAEGCDVCTIEGFDTDPLMEALREEFNKQHALQCGFCTPGMLISAHDIVNRLGNPGEERVREELAGNLCRCTGYAGIVQAVRNVGAAHGEIVGGAGKAAQSAASAQAAAIPSIPASIPLQSHSSADASASNMLGANVVEKSLVIDAASDKVWTFFRDLPSVAACIPGAELVDYDSRNFNARVGVKFGPIRASLAGTGTFAFNDDARTGLLTGSGRDVLTGSLISGSLKFSIAESSSGSTRVDTAMTFKLSGMLAQFSRGSIAKELVSRVMNQFAKNASATLSGAGIPSPGTTTEPGAFNSFCSRIAAALRSFLRRRG